MKFARLLPLLVLLFLSGCVTTETVIRTGERIPASLPVTFEGFVAYVDGRTEKDPFVGVWESDNNRYTLGVYRDENDKRYPYKAFVIDSKVRGWMPGEVKIKFSKLDWTGIALSRYLMGNKLEISATWRSSPNVFLGLKPGVISNSVLVKTYPRVESAPKRGHGSGSGWYAGSGYVVTNAHVVEGASEISVTHDGTKVKARVSLLDQKLDLAVLKLEEVSSKLRAAPVAHRFSAGQRIYAMGFPLGKTLGSAPKISDGVIGALQGLGSDPTQLTITTPIQPGSSGGPVFDEFGGVVGVVVAKLRNTASPDLDTENVNYAVNIKYVTPLLETLGVDLGANQVQEAANICDLRCSSVVYVETE